MVLERVITTFTSEIKTTKESGHLKNPKIDAADNWNYSQSRNNRLKMVEPTLPKDAILELIDIHYRTQQNIREQTVNAKYFNLYLLILSSSHHLYKNCLLSE